MHGEGNLTRVLAPQVRRSILDVILTEACLLLFCEAAMRRSTEHNQINNILYSLDGYFSPELKGVRYLNMQLKDDSTKINAATVLIAWN